MQKAGCPSGQIFDHHNKVCVIPNQNLKPMMKWPGGKSRVSKEIVKQIPDHDMYVEPFVGGGSIYFQKDTADVNVINDKNKNLTNFYKNMSKVSPNEMVGCKHPTQKQWHNIKDKRDNGEPLGTCEFWQIVTGSYGGMTNSYGYAKKGKRKQLGVNTIKNIDHYQHKLKKTRKTSNDYRVTKKYDGKNTFYYVDPPVLCKSAVGN